MAPPANVVMLSEAKHLAVAVHSAMVRPRLDACARTDIVIFSFASTGRVRRGRDVKIAVRVFLDASVGRIAGEKQQP